MAGAVETASGSSGNAVFSYWIFPVQIVAVLSIWVLGKALNGPWEEAATMFIGGWSLALATTASLVVAIALRRTIYTPSIRLVWIALLCFIVVPIVWFLMHVAARWTYAGVMIRCCGGGEFFMADIWGRLLALPQSNLTAAILASIAATAFGVFAFQVREKALPFLSSAVLCATGTVVGLLALYAAAHETAV